MTTTVISNEDFREFASKHLQQLLKVAVRTGNRTDGRFSLTRPFLGALLAQGAQLEELFDAYGATSNSHWSPLRMRIATIKNFSQIGYELIHLTHAAGYYGLLPVNGDFLEDTEEAIDFIVAVLDCTLKQLVIDSRSSGIVIPQPDEDTPGDGEALPKGMLARDLQTRHERSVAERVVHLATSFLAVSVEGTFLNRARDADLNNARAMIPDVISEENLRRVEYRLHALQSLYDTYVSDSATETTDADLRRLRGHISATLHLIRVATILVHFHERHLTTHHRALFCHAQCVFLGDAFYKVLFAYCLRFSSLYLEAGSGICRQMLKRYASVTEIEVPIPSYHGFHVRPSTLIAKIVQHYGSEVTMRLGGTVYDAGTPLELFRANEQINAEKRRHVTSAIAELPLDASITSRTQLEMAIRKAILHLAAKDILAVHEYPPPLDDLLDTTCNTVREALLDTIASLLAMGKIDIQMEIKVTFSGDRRVLQDIRVLAENGYGEDEMGANIPLPQEIAYLRR